ncbi:32858_t:CDS:2, partial [Gigaspora margarita]
VQPHPEKSEHTISKLLWNMPFSRTSATNADHWDMWHWKTEKLKQELEIHNINKENKNINFVGPSAMNTDRSNRFIAKEMVSELQKIAKNGKISEDNEIPTEQVIKSWISRFSKSSKELLAAESLA